MNKTVLTLIAVASLISCHKKATEETPLSNTQEQMATGYKPFIKVADLLNSYDEKPKTDLSGFFNLEFNKTTPVQALEIMKGQGFRLSEQQGYDDEVIDQYYEGKLFNHFDIEVGLYFSQKGFTQLVFDVPYEDKAAFFKAMANQYGRPVFDEVTSNTYAWGFNNAAIVYQQQMDGGQVSIYSFDSLMQ